MTSVIQSDKIGFSFTITLTQDVGLASTARMNHAHFR